jgi:ABC-type phosphate/phosphonate transport system substrate-binding protein
VIASLPMYDRPETRAANDRLWQLIRANLPDETKSAPETLARTGDPWSDWLSPELLLSQTCGLPYRARLHGRVTLVGTPVHDLPCAPGHYFSAVVARSDDPRAAVADFAGARIAVNDGLSQSGWAAPQALAAAHGFAFTDVTLTGSHRASAEAVAAGAADLAAIDAVTWRMIRRWDTFAAELRVIAETPPTPALPYITNRRRDPDDLCRAIGDAIRALDAEDRDTLCLAGITRLPADRYLSIPTPPPPAKTAASA